MKTRLQFISIVLIAAVCPASGETLLSNLSTSPDLFNGFNDTSFFQGFDFRTSSSFTIADTVTLGIFNAGSIPHTFTAAIYNNTAQNSPGIPVGIFDEVILVNPTGNSPGTTVNATGHDAGIPLAPDTVYWLVVRMNENPSTPAGQTANWTSNNSQVPDVGSSFTYIPAVNNKVSLDAGINWEHTFNGNFRASIGGQVIPEPASGGLMLCGCAWLLSARRRK